MAPLTPHWQQPSHPDIQKVVILNEVEFTTKSLSRVALPPFALFARFDFPPCTEAAEPTYATVQMGRNRHLNLNSDLLYINHSCEPSLIFDTGNKIIIAGPKGLQPDDELTFFYPSTEWEMSQPFQCLCGTPTCKGTIDGAKNMTSAQLDGLWLSKHIRELRAEQAATVGSTSPPSPAADPTTEALQNAIDQAEKVVEAARAALLSYTGTAGRNGSQLPRNGGGKANGVGRRGGPTSRELSGEMGGDTAIRA
ncbi:galactose-proton symport, putative [Cordyceps militaris CM01]|uniref:Galactose-proton symport, putative n=1 Tax=Cordyceps militaris (strain CM01) TaxID=983644 RepID=G3JA56_CORMM|nr:galactose-proton symport, putative [Cordyceps militaris CM01]EGX94226.1 galactose-proton symport, putative [Cordyceps militaris CM01]